MKKRFLLAILACLVSVLMLATTACSSGSKDSGTNAPAAQTAAPAPAADAPAAPAEPAAPVAADDSIIPEKTVTLDVYSQLANYSGEQVGWFAKVMLDKFNVKLNIIPQSEGVFATRMESGSLGDIVVFGHDGDEYTQAIQGGMLFDWESEDLLNDYGQYIQANMQKALEKNRVVSGDGHIYGFGHNVGTSLTEHEAFFYYPDIRWDLYKELGYPEIKTLEDYVGVLEGMQKLAPTSDTGGKTYGVSLFPDWDGDMVMFVKATAALYGWDEFGFGLYNPVTQEYQDCLQLDGLYLRALKFYNTLYQKGLLNPDSMTQTFNDVTEDFQTGAAFFQLFNWLGSSNYNTDEHLAEGKMMYARTADDAKNLSYGLNTNGGDRVWTIGSKTNYPELCMAIINWFSTPDGVMTYNYGPKGVTWDYNADGKAYLTDLGLKTTSDGNTEMPAEYGGTYGDGSFKTNNTTWSADALNPEGNGETFNRIFWESAQGRDVSPIMQDWIDWSGYPNADEYLEGNGNIAIVPGSSYSVSAKSNELQTIWSQVATAVKDGSWKAIYANSDAEYDALVKEMIDSANSYGYAECVEFQKNEAVRRKAAEDESMK